MATEYKRNPVTGDLEASTAPDTEVPAPTSTEKVVCIVGKDGEAVGVNNGGLDVNLQDQSTRAISTIMCQNAGGPYFLAASSVPDTYELTLVNATGLSIGDRIGLFQNSAHPASYFGNILGIAGNVITMDTPLDIVFDIVDNSPIMFHLHCDMNVDGSITPEVFSVVNGADSAVDYTRIIIHILGSSSMDDGKFGNLTALLRGCVFRKKNAGGDYTNYFNVKTNGEIGELAYDKMYDDKAPAGVYGFSSRLTFGGQSKVGVVLRLSTNEELQLVVQDDLTGLVRFSITAEGHYTDEI